MITVTGRSRHVSRAVAGNVEFVNPFPQMSEPEARVYLYLVSLGVPFSWRNFDGDSLAPSFATIAKPFITPEFTLTEYKVVIMVLGQYWGGLPAVVNTVSLAEVTLEADGWKVATLLEDEIKRDVERAIFDKLPGVNLGSIKGEPKTQVTSYDKFYVQRRKEYARAAGFQRRKFFEPLKNIDTFAGKRNPKRGDRRQSNRINIQTNKPTVSFTGASRLSGTIAKGNPKVARKASNRFALPLWRKDDGK
jgi:hypothetical protein